MLGGIGMNNKAEYIRMGIDRKLTDYSQITHRLSLYNV